MAVKYKNICQGMFKSRPNRFIANVEIDGELTTVHVKNTGRCKELLTQDATVYLEKSDKTVDPMTMETYLYYVKQE